MSSWAHWRFDFESMACPCTLLIDGHKESQVRAAAQAAIDEVRRIEHKYSRYRADSVIARVNQQAAGAAVEVDEETASLLDFAQALWQQSDGLFDITSGVLRQAWNFKAGTPPAQADIERLLPRIGWPKVERKDRHHVRLTQPQMEIDFGGFGKEYAVDRAAVLLKTMGVAHALINLGGDLYALGPRGLPELAGTAWLVDIQNPRSSGHPQAKNQAISQIGLVDQAMATSGDYERFFIHQGRRYCHLLNPHTGWPVDHFQSVTVLASNTTTAGALSTVAMLKADEGLHWLQQQQASYVAVSHNGEVLTSWND